MQTTGRSLVILVLALCGCSGSQNNDVAAHRALQHLEDAVRDEVRGWKEGVDPLEVAYGLRGGTAHFEGYRSGVRYEILRREIEGLRAEGEIIVADVQIAILSVTSGEVSSVTIYVDGESATRWRLSKLLIEESNKMGWNVNVAANPLD